MSSFTPLAYPAWGLSTQRDMQVFAHSSEQNLGLGVPQSLSAKPSLHVQASKALVRSPWPLAALQLPAHSLICTSHLRDPASFFHPG